MYKGKKAYLETKIKEFIDKWIDIKLKQNMTIKELSTILKYSDVCNDYEVKVEVRYPDGGRERCRIESIIVYSDGIALNVKTEKKV